MQRESEWKKGGWGGIDSQMWRRIYVTDLHGPMGKLGKCSEMRVHDHNIKAKAEQKLTCKQAQTCRQTHTKAGLMFHDWNETKKKKVGFADRGFLETKVFVPPWPHHNIFFLCKIQAFKMGEIFFSGNHFLKQTFTHDL